MTTRPGLKNVIEPSDADMSASPETVREYVFQLEAEIDYLNDKITRRMSCCGAIGAEACMKEDRTGEECPANQKGKVCHGEGLVCEDHPDKAWKSGDGCCGGAGMQCRVCSKQPVIDDGLRERALNDMPNIVGTYGSNAQKISMERLLNWYDAHYSTIRAALKSYQEGGL